MAKLQTSDSKFQENFKPQDSRPECRNSFAGTSMAGREKRTGDFQEGRALFGPGKSQGPEGPFEKRGEGAPGEIWIIQSASGLPLMRLTCGWGA
jgi:hypothetical protein